MTKTAYHIVTKFIPLPRIIDAPGKYRTRGGDVVEVFHIAERRDPSGWHRAWGEYDDGVKECWEISGLILPTLETDNDIIEKIA